MVVSKRVLKISLIFLFVVSLAGLFLYKDPISVFQFLELTSLRLKGVKTESTENFYYFEKNNCNSESCQCVLLIHGLGDFAFTWSKTLESENLNGVRLIAVNLPGSLSSPLLRQEKDYSLDSIVHLLRTQVLGLCEDWVVVGNSFGGWLAVRMAEQDSRVKKLVLNAPAGLKKDYSHITEYFLNPSITEAQAFYKKAYANPLPVPEFIFQSVVERAKQVPVVPMLKAVSEEDYIQSEIKLNRPVNIIWGEKDGVLLTSWAKEYQNYLVGSHLEIIKGCGHIPQKECFTEFEKTLVKTIEIN